MRVFAAFAFAALLSGSAVTAGSSSEHEQSYGITRLAGDAVDLDSRLEQPLAHLAEPDLGQSHHRALLMKKKKKKSRKPKRRSPPRRKKKSSKKKKTSKKKKSSPKKKKPSPKKKKPSSKRRGRPSKPAPKKPKGKPTSKGSSIQSIITTPVSKCGSQASEIPTGRHQDFLKPPEEAAAEYSSILTNGKFKMSYGTIPRGGEYCTAASSSAEKVMFGGMMFFHNKGKCYLPPTKRSGGSCCQMYAWQPNTEGFYFDNCSMKMSIGGDGKWWFMTEIPGDESKVGWGPDPAPHIHYDIRCSGCAPTNAYDTSKYQYWSKFYAREICTIDKCGGVKKDEHMATETKGPGGVTVFKYNFELPAKSKGKL